MLGFHVGFRDYITFIVIFIIGVAFVGLLVFMLGLPGRIAIARKHRGRAAQDFDPHAFVTQLALTDQFLK